MATAEMTNLKKEERKANPLWSIPLMIIFMVSVLLPGVVTASLIWDGAQDGNASWIVMGIIGGAFWLLGLYIVLRKKKNKRT